MQEKRKSGGGIGPAGQEERDKTVRDREKREGDKGRKGGESKV